MNCHACGAQLSTTARFCHKCGAAVGSVKAGGWRAGFPWLLTGAAVGALVAILAMRGVRNGEPGAAAAPSGGVRAAPDISQMSPQERATRLFNRVMILAEAGRNDSVRFFLPMAIGAYSQLPAPDPDARYHLGRLQLIGGDAAAALAQADTIQRTPGAATHLFIYLLRADAYQRQGNAQQQRRAYSDFLRNEQAELARNRPEYQDHRESLTTFHAEATQAAR
jgi:hypothetical protein